MEKYYLVSYFYQRPTSSGFGNIFLKTDSYLDIKKAEKEIVKRKNLTEKNEFEVELVVIIAINKITKEQFLF